jgi:rhodanese-related sulfurtransferase
LDTLPQADYRKAHSPAAMCIPSDDIMDDTPRRIQDRDTEIVVYCANSPCKRSRLAADRLESLWAQSVGVLLWSSVDSG